MEKITVSKTYALIYQIKGNENYKISPCGKVFNTVKRTEIKRVLNGGSVGFFIGGKFQTLKSIRENSEIIKENILPF